jgi:hypothetical protein
MFDSEYHIFRDYDMPFDERGSQCGVIRKVQWVKPGSEPDESKGKLEIRKIYLSSDGSERLAKGYTFSTEEGPHELVQNLSKIGYGHTKDMLKILSKRDDFKESIENIDKDDNSDDGEVYDMRDLLLSIENNEDIEDEA